MSRQKGLLHLCVAKWTSPSYRFAKITSLVWGERAKVGNESEFRGKRRDEDRAAGWHITGYHLRIGGSKRKTGAVISDCACLELLKLVICDGGKLRGPPHQDLQGRAKS